jgi:signal transduction histidine kinase
MRGGAELALAQDDVAAKNEALADCVERSDEVLRLLRALMEISEAEAGMLKLEKTACDLGELARGAGGLYDEIATAKQISLSIEAMDTPVRADATRLRQAVANLIDNAIKYTPDGGRVVVATTRRENQAVLTISDSGPGVPEAEQTRIWERLYRGDQSRSQSGLGLGLSLVRAIVEAHGGRASVRNAPSGGAVFEVTLPLE